MNWNKATGTAAGSVWLGLAMLLVVGSVGAQELPFQTLTVESVTLPRERMFDAVIEAVKQATVSAQTAGRVVEIPVDVDDYVEKGSVIVRFRDKEQRARFVAAEARYNEASAEFKRVKEVYEKKLVSRAAYDKAEAELKAAGAQLDQAREGLENTVVRAPYSGIVVERHIEVGEVAAVGQRLLTGLSLESLRATTQVPQDIINQLRADGRARVLLPGGDPRGVPAESLTISPYADPAAHTFQVRVNLPAGKRGIYPGMFAKVAFTVAEEQGLLIPSNAVAKRSEVTAVYVVDDDNQVSLRQIRIGRVLADGNVVVLAGLDAGTRVSLDPLRAAVLLGEQRGAMANE